MVFILNHISNPLFSMILLYYAGIQLFTPPPQKHLIINNLRLRAGRNRVKPVACIYKGCLAPVPAKYAKICRNGKRVVPPMQPSN